MSVEYDFQKLFGYVILMDLFIIFMYILKE